MQNDGRTLRQFFISAKSKFLNRKHNIKYIHLSVFFVEYSCRIIIKLNKINGMFGTGHGNRLINPISAHDKYGLLVVIPKLHYTILICFLDKTILLLNLHCTKILLYRVCNITEIFITLTLICCNLENQRTFILIHK